MLDTARYSDRAIAEPTSKLSINMRHGFIASFVTRSCACEHASGLSQSKHLRKFAQIPLMASGDMRAMNLKAAKNIMSGFGYAHSMRLYHPRDTAVSEGQNLAVPDCVDDGLPHWDSPFRVISRASASSSLALSACAALA